MFASLAVGLIIIIIIIISDQKENFSFGNHPTEQLPQLPSAPGPQMSKTVVTRMSKPESIKKLNSPHADNNNQWMNQSIFINRY